MAFPYLHGPGVHVGEHLLPGQRVLVISKCFGQAFLEANPRNLFKIWSGLGRGLRLAGSLPANHLRVEKGSQAMGSSLGLMTTHGTQEQWSTACGKQWA